MAFMTPFFEVTVSNIGCVHKSDDINQAIASYVGYATLSATGVGRAGNEEVTLWVDGEPRLEYSPSIGLGFNISLQFTAWLRSAVDDGPELGTHERALAAQALRQALQEHSLLRKTWQQDVLDAAEDNFAELVVATQGSVMGHNNDANDIWFDIADFDDPRFDVSLASGPQFPAPSIVAPQIQQLLLEYAKIPDDEDSEDEDSEDENNSDSGSQDDFGTKV